MHFLYSSNGHIAQLFVNHLKRVAHKGVNKCSWGWKILLIAWYAWVHLKKIISRWFVSCIKWTTAIYTLALWHYLYEMYTLYQVFKYNAGIRKDVTKIHMHSRTAYANAMKAAYIVIPSWTLTQSVRIERVWCVWWTAYSWFHILICFI